MSDTRLTLANGRSIDLLAPTAADIDWNAIAEQLAKECRYNGATPGQAYSVAQHSCLGSDAILRERGDRQLAAYFHLHDVHESVLKDDTTPKKRALAAIAAQEFGVLATSIMSAFARLTYRHDVAIHEAAGLPWPPTIETQNAIKLYDLRAFVTEWRDLMHGIEHPDWTPYASIAPLDRPVGDVWPWSFAMRAWLYRARQLLPSLIGCDR